MPDGHLLGAWEERVPAALRAVAATLTAAGHSAYLVGGSLRDLLSGREPADWDLATSAHPAEVRRLFARVIPTGEKHGTMTVLAGGAAYEVTTLRADGVYSDMRRPDSVVTSNGSGRITVSFTRMSWNSTVWGKLSLGTIRGCSQEEATCRLLP